MNSNTNTIQSFLLGLSNNITKDKLSETKFLLQQILPPAELQQCTQARDVFSLLLQRNLIGSNNLAGLETLFEHMSLHNLVKKTRDFQGTIQNQGATPLSNDYNTLQISPFIVFLNILCNDLTSENNKDLKWLILDKIPKGTLEGCQKARDTISIMLEMNLINEHDLNLLRELLEKVNRQDLASKNFVQTRSFIDGASRSGTDTTDAQNGEVYNQNTDQPRDQVPEVPQLPHPPLNVRSEPTGAKSIRVSWDPVPTVDQNGVITHHVVYYKAVEGGYREEQTKIVVGSEGTTTVLTALEEHVKYHITVAAVTRVGKGPRSSVTFVRTNQAKPAKPPQNIRSEPTGAKSIRVSWDPVPTVDQNGVITHHVVYYKAVEGGYREEQTKIVDDSEGTTTDLTALEEYVQYQISVAAVTSAGEGPRTSVIVVRTHQAKPAKPPQNIRSEPTGAKSIRVSWDPVPTLDQNGVITHHVVYYKAVESGYREESEQTKIVDGSEGTTTDLTALKKYVQYQISVAAVTNVGEGPKSSFTVARTHQAKPGKPPQNVSGQPTGAKSIRVSWDPVPTVDQNGVITRHVVYYKAVEGGYREEQTKIVDGSEGTTTVLTALEEYVKYEISAAAVTSAGEGPRSSVTFVMTNQASTDTAHTQNGEISGQNTVQLQDPESENNYTRSTLEDALNDIEIPEFEVHTPDELAQNVSFGTASRKKKMLRRSVYVVLQDEEGSREQTIGTTCIVRVKKKETSKCKYFYLTHDEVVRDQSNLCMERSCSRLLKRKHKETLTKDQELKTCFLRNNLSLCLIPVYEVTEQPRSFLDLDVDYAKTVDSNKANPAKFRTYTVRAKDFVKIYLKRNDQNTWQPREYKFKPNKHSEAEHARVCGAPVVVKDEQRDLKVVGIMGSDYIPILISAPAPHRMARDSSIANLQIL